MFLEPEVVLTIFAFLGSVGGASVVDVDRFLRFWLGVADVFVRRGCAGPRLVCARGALFCFCALLPTPAIS